MATKRNKYIMKHGDVIDIEEYHDGNYGAKGIKRKMCIRDSNMP